MTKHLNGGSSAKYGRIAVLVLGLAWFAVESATDRSVALPNQCAGYEELEPAPGDVSGLGELDPPPCQ